MTTFGSQLRELRRARGLTIQELAKRAQFDRGQLSRLECGLAPSLNAIGKIARGLDVDPVLLAAPAVRQAAEDRE